MFYRFLKTLSHVFQKVKRQLFKKPALMWFGKHLVYSSQGFNDCDGTIVIFPLKVQKVLGYLELLYEHCKQNGSEWIALGVVERGLDSLSSTQII